MMMSQDDRNRVPARDEAPIGPPVRGRAAIYHFLELALAHPDEDGLDWISAPSTEAAFYEELDALPRGEALVEAKTASGKFFEAVREQSHEAVEAAHIALFSANFPSVPCPPYGSLFTVEEAKRLEEMLAIKAFYRDSGFDLSDAFDDLPDHLCVELELLHALSFREQTAEDPREIAWSQERAAAFMDRFLTPFLDRLSEIASVAEPDNCYADLLAATRHIVAHHRAGSVDAADRASSIKGHLS